MSTWTNQSKIVGQVGVPYNSTYTYNNPLTYNGTLFTGWSNQIKN